MSGSIYVRVMWIRTKKEILLTNLRRFDPFEPLGPRKPETKLTRLRARYRRHGRYWRYRNLQCMRQLNWDRRRYGL